MIHAVAAKYGCIAWLPHDNIAHDRRGHDLRFVSKSTVCERVNTLYGATTMRETGLRTRLQPMAKKLKGDMAATKPSRPLYSSLFHTPALWSAGCCACTAAAYFEPNLKKSGNSVPASISACHMFLPVPSIVAAQICARRGPLIMSAALSAIATRSSRRKFSQCLRASNAPLTASWYCKKNDIVSQGIAGRRVGKVDASEANLSSRRAVECAESVAVLTGHNLHTNGKSACVCVCMCVEGGEGGGGRAVETPTWHNNCHKSKTPDG